MNSAKRFLMVAGAFVLATLTFTLANPKAVHAFAATLVQIMNTNSTPVPVQPDGRNVVTLQMFFQLVDGVRSGDAAMLDSTFTPYTVPAGKRLVIDTVSLFAFMPPGEKPSAWFFNGNTFTALPALPIGSFTPGLLSSSEDWFQNAIPVRDYLDPGAQYVVTPIRSASTGTAEINVFAHGHLVDCTNGGGC